MIHEAIFGFTVLSIACAVGCGSADTSEPGTRSASSGPACTDIIAADAYFDGTKVSFTFSSASNIVYTVEYKDSLSDRAWTTLTIVSGDGSPATITDFSYKEHGGTVDSLCFSPDGSLLASIGRGRRAPAYLANVSCTSCGRNITWSVARNAIAKAMKAVGADG